MSEPAFSEANGRGFCVRPNLGAVDVEAAIGKSVGIPLQVVRGPAMV